ncbi:MAG: universal stress protein [Rhodospirillaceae bacterium]|nr:universal stress protein [Rhodospirillaceae bacterium]
MIKRILVGVSGTPSTGSKIDYILDLAQRHEAKLDILSIIDVDRLSHVGMVPIGAGGMAEMLRKDRIKQSAENATAAIQTVIARANEQGVPYTQLLAEGDPFKILAEHWQYNDLCVLGLRDWFDHGVVPDPEDVLLHLAKEGVRPILAVGEGYRPVRKALINFNGTKSSANAMKRFVQMCLWPGMHLHIMAVEPSAAKAAVLLERAADYCRDHGYPVTTQHETGDPTTTILKTQREQDCDVIVMGVSFHRALLHTVFSEVTLGVIKGSDVPIFMNH